MPEWTVFSYWNEKYDDVTNLYKRYQSYWNDFVCQNLLFEHGFKYSNDWTESIVKFVESLNLGNDEYNDFDCAWRDGMFDEKQRFIVYDETDLKNLREQLY